MRCPFPPLSHWGGWMKTTCVNTAWCTALSASFREENQIGFLWQIITFVLNQQHFSQSEAVAPVVIGARLVLTPGGLGTFVTTFVSVWLRLAPMRQDVVNTSFAFVISWHGPRTSTSYEYYWGLHLVKKFNFQFQSSLLKLTSIISADMSTTEMLTMYEKPSDFDLLVC